MPILQWFRGWLPYSAEVDRTLPIADGESTTLHNESPSPISSAEPPPPYQDTRPSASRPANPNLITIMLQHCPTEAEVRSLPPQEPPPRTETPRGAAIAAITSASRGLFEAQFMDEPSLIIVHTIKAIAMAVSTSRSYGTFFAVTDALLAVHEAEAIYEAEGVRDEVSRQVAIERMRHAIVAAVEAGLAANAIATPAGS